MNESIFLIWLNILPFIFDYLTFNIFLLFNSHVSSKSNWFYNLIFLSVLNQMTRSNLLVVVGLPFICSNEFIKNGAFSIVALKQSYEIKNKYISA